MGVIQILAAVCGVVLGLGTLFYRSMLGFVPIIMAVLSFGLLQSFCYIGSDLAFCFDGTGTMATLVKLGLAIGSAVLGAWTLGRAKANHAIDIASKY